MSYRKGAVVYLYSRDQQVKSPDLTWDMKPGAVVNSESLSWGWERIGEDLVVLDLGAMVTQTSVSSPVLVDS